MVYRVETVGKRPAVPHSIGLEKTQKFFPGVKGGDVLQGGPEELAVLPVNHKVGVQGSGVLFRGHGETGEDILRPVRGFRNHKIGDFGDAGSIFAIRPLQSYQPGLFNVFKLYSAPNRNSTGITFK